MRRTLLLLLSFLTCVAWGQTYRYRYWLDNNVGSAVSGSATGEKELTISLSSVGYGMHAIHVQGRNSAGVWSSVRTRYFLKEKSDQTCTSARYWIDNDMTTLHNSVATSGVIELDIAGLEYGLHAVHYQKMGADGTPSAVRTRYFLKEEENLTCTSARYWIDSDMTTLHNSVATSGVIELDISSLDYGLHAVHYQKIGTDGIPSAVRTRYFLKEEENQTYTSARYWIDNDMTTLHDNVATSGIIDIDITKLGVGLHAVHYQKIGTDGTPSAVRTRYFLVDRVQKGSLTADISIDDGVVTNYALSDEDIVIDVTDLAEGTHSLLVTLLDAKGKVIGQEEQEFEINREQPSPAIEFADATVKSICVELWDTDGDGELNYEEAATVTSLDGAFSTYECSYVESFNELQYFTGLIALFYNDLSGMRMLKSIVIPRGVETIGLYTFNDMPLESIQVDAANPYYDSRNNCNALIQTVTNRLIKGTANTIIPASVSIIGEKAFYDSDWNGSLPEGLSEIEENAFMGCTRFESLVIPASVTYIGEGAFNRCHLESINVDTDNEVYDSRNNCNALIETSTNTLLLGTGSTVIPTSVTTIGNSAFEGCSSTSAMVIPDNVMTIGENAFSGSRFSSITLPEGLTAISKHMMSLCYNLTEIEIPSEVTSIGYYAFYADKALTSVDIPSKVESIAEGAFSYCDNLERITIPASVTSIEKNAFLSSMNLVHVEVGMMAPITIDATAFPNRANATLYVPVGTKSLYENAPYWEEFNEIVEVVSTVAGDANGDGTVNVTDYLAVANYILGLNYSNFNVTAADVNGDGDVNVTDYVGVANIILYGRSQGTSVNAVMALNADESSTWMELEPTKDGKINLQLHNIKPFSAFQMDIQLPDGVEIVEASMAKANQTKNLGYTRLQNGTWRLLYGTLENKAINLLDDTLLTLELACSKSNAGGFVTIDHIFLVKSDTSTIQLGAVQGGLPTGIYVIESQSSIDGDSYDLTGRKVDNSQLRKGIYVVNGKKLYVK